MDTHFATADAYSHNLAKVGVAAHEVVVDAARCSGPGRASTTSTLDGDALVLEQVRWFEPDVVYLQNLNVLDDATLTSDSSDGKLARRARSQARRRARIASACSTSLLTSFPHYVERFRALGVELGVLPHRLRSANPGRPRRRGPATRGRLRRSAQPAAPPARQQHLQPRRPARPIEFWGYDLRGWPPWSRIRRELPRPGLGARDVPAPPRRAHLAQPAHRRGGGPCEQHEAVRGHGRRLAAAHRRGVEPGRALRARSRGRNVRGRGRPGREGTALPRRTRTSGGRSRRPARPGRCASTPTSCGCESWRRSCGATCRDPPRPGPRVRRQARSHHRRARLHRLEPRARAPRAGRRRHDRRLARARSTAACSTTSPASRTG